MRIENERKSNDVIFDVDMSDSERESLLSYGKNNITDDVLIEFAMQDIMKHQLDRQDLLTNAKLVNDLLSNAAELGCPADREVDMWYRELTIDEQCDVIDHLNSIHADYAKYADEN